MCTLHRLARDTRRCAVWPPLCLRSVPTSGSAPALVPCVPGIPGFAGSGFCRVASFAGGCHASGRKSGHGFERRDPASGSDLSPCPAASRRGTTTAAACDASARSSLLFPSAHLSRGCGDSAVGSTAVARSLRTQQLGSSSGPGVNLGRWHMAGWGRFRMEVFPRADQVRSAVLCDLVASSVPRVGRCARLCWRTLPRDDHGDLGHVRGSSVALLLGASRCSRGVLAGGARPSCHARAALPLVLKLPPPQAVVWVRRLIEEGIEPNPGPEIVDMDGIDGDTFFGITAEDVTWAADAENYDVLLLSLSDSDLESGPMVALVPVRPPAESGGPILVAVPQSAHGRRLTARVIPSALVVKAAFTDLACLPYDDFSAIGSSPAAGGFGEADLVMAKAVLLQLDSSAWPRIRKAFDWESPPAYQFIVNDVCVHPVTTSLLEVAEAKFPDGFATAASGEQGSVQAPKATVASRVASLETALGGVQASLAVIQGLLTQHVPLAAPPPAPRQGVPPPGPGVAPKARVSGAPPRSSTAGKASGADTAVVREALAAGISQEEVEKVMAIISGVGSQMRPPPRPVLQQPRPGGPLEESADEEEAPVAVTHSPIEMAVLELTRLTKSLVKDPRASDPLEQALEGLGSGGSDGIGVTLFSWKGAAAMLQLKKTLKERPRVIAAAMRRRMLEECGRAEGIATIDSLTASSSTALPAPDPFFWAEHRSRVPGARLGIPVVARCCPTPSARGLCPRRRGGGLVA